MTAPQWDRLRERAAVDSDVRAIIEITLTHAMGQVRSAKPGNVTLMNYHGGLRRAVTVLRNLRGEIKTTGAQ